MRNGILFFHYRIAESLAEFVAQKDRVVAKAVVSAILVDNLAIGATASADITTVRVAQHDHALKVCRSIDLSVFL